MQFYQFLETLFLTVIGLGYNRRIVPIVPDFFQHWKYVFLAKSYQISTDLFWQE